MADPVRTEQAQNELDAVIKYYERIGADDFAKVFEEKVIEKIRPLDQFPRMGCIVSEIGDEATREVLYCTYRSVYVVDQDDGEVDVLTTFHSTQQFGARASDDE